MEDLIGTWGYLALFLFLFLENSALVGLVVPGITVLVAAAFASGTGTLNVAAVFGVAWIAVFLGDTVCYLLGKFVVQRSARIRDIAGRIPPDRIDRWYVIFYQFPVASRIAVPIVAGSAGLSIRRAVLLESISTTVFVLSITAIGHIVGRVVGSLDSATKVVEYLQYGFLLLLAGWVVWTAVTVVRMRRQSR